MRQRAGVGGAERQAIRRFVIGRLGEQWWTVIFRFPFVLVSVAPFVLSHAIPFARSDLEEFLLFTAERLVDQLHVLVG
ncbi:MAG: hypothetical protein M3P52_09940, partial [Actinomycetota bacterium]|nr:hypothetical protein [Actinomycetota bacterium]